MKNIGWGLEVKILMDMYSDFHIFCANGLRVILRNLKTYLMIYLSLVILKKPFLMPNNFKLAYKIFSQS